MTRSSHRYLRLLHQNWVTNLSPAKNFLRVYCRKPHAPMRTTDQTLAAHLVQNGKPLDTVREPNKFGFMDGLAVLGEKTGIIHRRIVFLARVFFVFTENRISSFISWRVGSASGTVALVPKLAFLPGAKLAV